MDGAAELRAEVGWAAAHHHMRHHRVPRVWNRVPCVGKYQGSRRSCKSRDYSCLLPATVRPTCSPSARRIGSYTYSLCLFCLSTLIRSGNPFTGLFTRQSRIAITMQTEVYGDVWEKSVWIFDWRSVCRTACRISRLLHNYAAWWCGGRSYQRQTAGVANPLISISMLGRAPLAVGPIQ